MGAVKEIVAGGIVAGAGAALRIIGQVIFSTFGASEGPYVDYRILIELASTGLIGLGALIAAYGLLHGIYRVWRRRGRTTDKDGTDRARQGYDEQTAPAAQDERPRHPRDRRPNREKPR